MHQEGHAEDVHEICNFECEVEKVRERGESRGYVERIPERLACLKRLGFGHACGSGLR